MSVTYSDYRLTRNTIIVSVLTFLGLWIIKPHDVFVFNSADHLARLILLLMIGWIGLFINKIYIKRLNQIELQIDMEKYLRESYNYLTNLEPDNLRENLLKVLENSTEFLEVDGAVILLRTDKGIKDFSWYKSNELKNKTDILVTSLKTVIAYGSCNQSILEGEGISNINFGLEIKNNNFIIKSIMNRDKILGALLLFDFKKYLALSSLKINTLNHLYNRLSIEIHKYNSDEKINNLINKDELSGFASRYALNGFMQDKIDLSNDFSFILISIDNLNVINEVLGYNKVDSLVKQWIGHFDAAITHVHFSARFSSSIFGIVIMNCIDEKQISNTIDDALSRAFRNIKSKSFPISLDLNIGIVSFDSRIEKNISYEMLQQQAEIALSNSRESRGKVVFYKDNLYENFLESLQLENDLKKAINEEQFILYYQPKVNI